MNAKITCVHIYSFIDIIFVFYGLYPGNIKLDT